jgi:uncharacterized protein YdhG (YjbR/CyaY superfamily)
MAHATHDDYFTTVPAEVRPLLEAIQAEVERVVPTAQRCISYQMPAYRTGTGKNRVFFYFAAFKKHIGVYPPVHDEALRYELSSWRGPKDNLIFPLKEAVPITLIGHVAAALAEQYAQSAAVAPPVK